jgi:endonuclease/exonuclease/phosphatase family metal-dependent hydrolase
MIRKFILLIILLLLQVACTEKDIKGTTAVITDSNLFKKDYLTIATFNLEWLGDGHRDRKKRNEEDYKRIANVIKDLDADIIGLQEVENKRALERVATYLPHYKYIIGHTGGAQKLAILFRDNLAVTFYNDYYPVMVAKRKTKAGLWVYVRAHNFDFHLMNVHFKSSSHWDNTKEKRKKSILYRTLQAKAVAKWADSILTNTEEEDVIIIGDLNDTPLRKKNNTIGLLSDHLIYLTDDLRSCKYSRNYTIDHILVSDTTAIRYIEDSEFMYNLKNKFSPNELKGISDHCPVTVEFDVTIPDNDGPEQITKK